MTLTQKLKSKQLRMIADVNLYPSPNTQTYTHIKIQAYRKDYTLKIG